MRFVNLLESMVFGGFEVKLSKHAVARAKERKIDLYSMVDVFEKIGGLRKEINNQEDKDRFVIIDHSRNLSIVFQKEKLNVLSVLTVYPSVKFAGRNAANIFQVGR